MLRLSMACVGQEELDEIQKVFLKTVNFGLGVHVKEFEDHIKAFIGEDVEVVCVNTGTSALHLALETLSFEAGSEVLVPSITFLASYSAIAQAGLKPVSCDVSFPSCHLDCEDLEKRIISKTVAIMPVAYAGCDFDRKKIYELADRYRLRVIEDDAHAFGSLNHDGKIFGASGDISCFSFDGIKNITCGEGGAIVTRDKSFAHQLRIRRSLGIEKDVELRYLGKRSWNYDVSVQGFRYHMSNINAAIGIAQLKKLDRFKTKKKQLLEEYDKHLSSSSLKDWILPTQNPKSSDLLHIFSCVLAEGLDRERFRTKLNDAGYETGIHYAPNHLHTMFKSSYNLPRSESLGARLISFPFHPNLEAEQIKGLMSACQQALQSMV